MIMIMRHFNVITSALFQVATCFLFVVFVVTSLRFERWMHCSSRGPSVTVHK